MGWIEALIKAFERLLRWFYPGVVFLILLYLFMKPTFLVLVHIKGYPWPLIIGGFGIGFVIYLIQVHIINQLFSILAQWTQWLVLSQDRRKPRFFSKKFVEWWDRQADDIETQYTDSDTRRSYMEYVNATYHALFITGWLTFVLFCFRENPSPLYEVKYWQIIIFLGTIFAASLNIFARVSRVRY